MLTLQNWIWLPVVCACANAPKSAENTTHSSVAASPHRIGTDELERLVDKRVTEELPKHAEAALVVAVMDGADAARDVVIGRGVISPEIPRPPDQKTLFFVGSITKVFTGLLLADAMGAGRVQADTTAQQLLPELAIPTKDGLSPTLLQLATHTSGLVPMFENWRPNANEFAALLKASELSDRPGNKMIYGNVGYALLGDAVARSWNQTFEEALHARILQPLGTQETGFMWTHPRSMRAQGYDENWQPVPDKINVPTQAGCCALESSAEDLLRLVHAYLDGTPKALQETLVRAAEPVVQGSGAFDDEMVGMGWFLSLPELMLLKNGSMAGYRSSIVIDRLTRRGVVVLANQTAFDTASVAQKVLRDISLRENSGKAFPTLGALPPSVTAANVRFENGLELVGYESPVSAVPGSVAHMTLYLKSTKQVEGDFRVFVHGDATGTRHRIHADHYPPGSTASWPMGFLVIDKVDVVIPKDTESGERKFYLGFFSGSRRLQILEGCRDGDRACGPIIHIKG